MFFVIQGRKSGHPTKVRKLVARAEGECTYLTLFAEYPLFRTCICAANPQKLILFGNCKVCAEKTRVLKKRVKKLLVFHKYSIVDVRMRSILVNTPY